MTTSNLMKYAIVNNKNHDEWSDVLEAVEKVYDGPSAIIAKTTRFGFTSSIAKIAEMRNDKLLIITPTNKIKETILKACPSAISIMGHSACKILAESNDELLLKLSLSLPSICPREGPCEEVPDCKLTVGWYKTAPVRTITYAKQTSLEFGYKLNEKSEVSLLREILKDVNVACYDESHEISLENSPSANMNYSIRNIPLEYERLRKIHFDFSELTRMLHTEYVTKNLEETRDYMKSEAFLSYCFENPTVIDRDFQTHAASELIHLAKRRASVNFTDEDILYLADVINVMTCRTVTANLTITRNGEIYTIKGKPTSSSPTMRNAISSFIREVCPKAKVFFVSGSQFEKYPGMFSEISGRELIHVCLDDVKQNNSKMTIVPVTWKYSSVAINGKDLSGTQNKRIKEQILDVLVEYPNEPIYIICFNKKLQTKILSMKLLLPDGSLIDYYRSSNSIGVECKARIGIAIGIANNPINTFDFATNNVAESRSLRFQSVHAATWQAWSRIKDPEGKMPSFLYCIGVRAEDVAAIIPQGSNRIVTYNGKNEKNRHIPPTITLSKELPRPKILVEKKSKWSLAPCNATSEMYIDCVVPLIDRIKDELAGLRLESLKSFDNHIYNTICENQRFLNFQDFKLYNPGENKYWIENNSVLFYTNIVSRIDKCGLQAHTPKPDGKHPYPNALIKIPFNDLLKQHFDGKETIALPPFDTNDVYYWCAADFDDHDGSNPQTSNVMKFGSYLRSLSLPYFVLLSGSNLGYHVWILLDPCKTYTAHKFIRQVLHDSGVELNKSIELYPKQKATSKSSKAFGGSLKLPNGYNWKASKRSILVDPITLEPVPYVSIPGVLRLHEINEVEIVEPAKKEIKHISVNYENDGRASGHIRPCLIKALDQQLTGGSGHTTRVVIANEAINAGMPRDLVIDLFKSQLDFVYETTANQVDFAIEKKYHNWKCSTIHDQCGECVDCENCPTSKMEIT